MQDAKCESDEASENDSEVPGEVPISRETYERIQRRLSSRDVSADDLLLDLLDRAKHSADFAHLVNDLIESTRPAQISLKKYGSDLSIIVYTSRNQNIDHILQAVDTVMVGDEEYEYDATINPYEPNNDDEYPIFDRGVLNERSLSTRMERIAEAKDWIQERNFTPI